MSIKGKFTTDDGLDFTYSVMSWEDSRTHRRHAGSTYSTGNFGRTESIIIDAKDIHGNHEYRYLYGPFPDQHYITESIKYMLSSRADDEITDPRLILGSGSTQ